MLSMIIKKIFYKCKECKKMYAFELGKPYSKICPICDIEMDMDGIYDCDTELAEKAQNTPSYNPITDPSSPYYKPIIKCPTCQSTNVNKIGAGERVVSVATLGPFSNKINKTFKCRSCGYTW